MIHFSPLEQMKELEYCQEVLSVFGIRFKIPAVLSRDRSSELVFHRALIASILVQKGLRPVKIGWIINKDRSNVCRLLNQYEKRKDAKRFNELRPRVLSYVTAQGILAQIRNLENVIEELKQQA